MLSKLRCYQLEMVLSLTGILCQPCSNTEGKFVVDRQKIKIKESNHLTKKIQERKKQRSIKQNKISKMAIVSKTLLFNNYFNMNGLKFSNQSTQNEWI